MYLTDRCGWSENGYQGHQGREQRGAVWIYQYFQKTSIAKAYILRQK
jgi:hypothetical protein